MSRLSIRFFAFVKSTLVGGLFVLAPLVLLAILAGKAIEVAYATLQPIVAWLPFDTIGGISLAFLFGIAAVVALCFLAGLLANIALTQRLVRWIESLLLSNLPGYALMKGVGENLVGVAGQSERQAALVRLHSSWAIGFVMDRLPNGRAIVFLPNVPNALTGTLHLIAVEQIIPLDLPIRTVLDFLNRLGADAAPAVRERLAQFPLPADP